MPLTSNFTIRNVYPVTSSGVADRNRDMFGELVKFFDAIPSWQRIASQSGSSGLGLGTTGDADSAGEEAFAVWRALSSSQPFDLVLKWSYSSFYSTDQLQIASSNWGVGIGVAFHSSSQAWNGTTKNDLSDTIPAGQPWKSGSMVFPRPNELDGAHETEGDREYVAALSITPPAAGKLFSVGDDDWFFLNVSSSNANDDRWFYFGSYLPLTTSYAAERTYPFAMLSDESGGCFDFDIQFGSTSESDGPDGGISFFSSSQAIEQELPRIGGIKLGTISTDFSDETRVEYSASVSPGPIKEYPIILYSAEVGFPGSVFGYLEHLRATNTNITNYDYLSQGNRFVVSSSTTMKYGQLTVPGTSSLTGSINEGVVRNFNTTFLTSSLFVTPTVISGGGGGSELVAVYRGENPPGTFVYSEGSPPSGASNVVIIGFK